MMLLVAVGGEGQEPTSAVWKREEAETALIERSGPAGGGPVERETRPFRTIAWTAVVLGIIGILYLVAKRWIRRKGPAGGSGLLRVLARRRVGPNQEIIMIEACGKILLLGCGKDGLTALTEWPGGREEPEDSKIVKVGPGRPPVRAG